MEHMSDTQSTKADDQQKCPVCGEEYSHRVSLSDRHGRSFSVSEYDRMCQDAEKRSGGPSMKATRSDSERYLFRGYFHE